jgi:hypothetical protein
MAQLVSFGILDRILVLWKAQAKRKGRHESLPVFILAMIANISGIHLTEPSHA